MISKNMNPPSLPVIREASAVSSTIKQINATSNSPSNPLINKSQAIKRAEFRINSIRTNNKTIQLPSLSKSYKSHTQENYSESKRYEYYKKERVLFRSKHGVKLPKLGDNVPNNNEAVHFREELPKTSEKYLFTESNNANQKDSFDQMNDENALINFLSKFETYERSKSPLDESIWSKEIQTMTTKPKNELIQLDLKFGSSLSEDGNYAMLKAYEDLLYHDILSINPKLIAPVLTRTKTEAFIKLPNKFPSSNESTPTPSSKEDAASIELKKHKYYVSKQLERAMKIKDLVNESKKNPENLNDYTKITNLLRKYQNWKHSCWQAVNE
jgi:hypothetical protein